MLWPDTPSASLVAGEWAWGPIMANKPQEKIWGLLGKISFSSKRAIRKETVLLALG